MTELLPFISVLSMRTAEVVELRGEIYTQRYFGLSPFLLHRFLVWFSRVKNSDLKYIVISVQMNFWHLYNPIKIQMLVRNSDGCMPSEISNQPILFFATPCDCHSLRLSRNIYRVFRVMTETCFCV